VSGTTVRTTRPSASSSRSRVESILSESSAGAHKLECATEGQAMGPERGRFTTRIWRGQNHHMTNRQRALELVDPMRSERSRGEQADMASCLSRVIR
jgi:hypothetical protein